MKYITEKEIIKYTGMQYFKRYKFIKKNILNKFIFVYKKNSSY